MLRVSHTNTPHPIDIPLTYTHTPTHSHTPTARLTSSSPFTRPPRPIPSPLLPTPTIAHHPHLVPFYLISLSPKCHGYLTGIHTPYPSLVSLTTHITYCSYHSPSFTHSLSHYSYPLVPNHSLIHYPHSFTTLIPLPTQQPPITTRAYDYSFTHHLITSLTHTP